MIKVQRKTNKSIFTKFKLHWIFIIILLILSVSISMCFAHKYFHNETKSNFTLNVYPQIVGENLIWYNISNNTNIQKWVNLTDEFVRVYRFAHFTPGRRDKTVMCDYGKTISKDKVCIIDMSFWDPCTAENNFGYYTTSPCVFLEAFEDRFWDLEYFHNVTELPKSMPESLIQKIELDVDDNPEKINTIWVECNGKSPADRENILEIKYFPFNGFPKYLFHNHNGLGYVRPAIAVQLLGIQTGIIVEVECKYWARNAQGVINFEMLVDE